MKRWMSVISVLLLMGALSSQAQVRVNKGPAFVSGEGSVLGKLSQGGLLSAYAVWNTTYDLINRGMRAKLSTQAFFDSSMKSTVLSPLDLEENNLQFGYRDESGRYFSWDFVETSYGYCHGITMVTRQFIYLAKFRPDLPINPSLRFYQNLVDEVMAGTKVEIPGYRDLREFSNSRIQIYLQRHVADQWGLNTARMPMLMNVQERTFDALKQKDVTRLRAQLQGFLKRGFYPRVVLGPGHYHLDDPHVVMVHRLFPSSEQCIDLEYFNVGTQAGGRMARARYCVGDYAWIPEDETSHYYNFVLGNR